MWGGMMEGGRRSCSERGKGGGGGGGGGGVQGRGLIGRR